jgi:hypothetical protein
MPPKITSASYARSSCESPLACRSRPSDGSRGNLSPKKCVRGLLSVTSVAFCNRRWLVDFRYAQLATEERPYGASESSKILASLKSGVSKPSVNQP